ncbi:hypothetical protein pdam_00006849 [Pocillopora damicornis]|uniref:Serine-threonine/tyrosine-protein kinase catalytic domain-containing protein n=1 Tax=Pocillopora damicornis TaxID=46731 RepID=A0A3M6TP44_POCDA|nr:hypothetical protein pdam_00006849 [Pocillopora damicornis]
MECMLKSVGKMPYSGLGGMEIIEFLKAGRILAKPDGCPDKIYDMMKSCWSLDSTKRPSFSELLESLEEEIKTEGDVPEDENYLEPEFNGTTNISMDESND